MTKTTLFSSLGLLISLTLSHLCAFESMAAATESRRPPQYVAFAFDGSLMLNRWEQTRAFAAQMNKKGVPFHFTYFLSGVYFLENSRKTSYVGPRHAAGASDIGFGGTEQSILTRTQEMNEAFVEGNELGSHLNGHFDGSHWSTDDWSQDFSTFFSLIFDVFKTNVITEPAHYQWAFTQNDIKGFRAPYLGTSPGLWETLRKFNFRYDTSLAELSDYWPDKTKGFWNFPLAELRIAGTAKKTLSMDYNFYVAQSGAKEDSQNSAFYEKQMYETYLNYFMSNYNGNRAPISIGHHFSLWNGGAYWKAEMAFAEKVCGLPEVKCSTYSELADYMDSLTPTQLAEYQKGDFVKGSPLTIATTLEKSYDLKLDLQKNNMTGVSIQANGDDSQSLSDRGMKMVWQIDGHVLPIAASVIDLDQLLKNKDVVEVSVKAMLDNLEVARTTKVVKYHRATKSFHVPDQDLEALSLIADPPQAHE